jgi:hypothetical protein
MEGGVLGGTWRVRHASDRKVQGSIPSPSKSPLGTQGFLTGSCSKGYLRLSYAPWVRPKPREPSVYLRGPSPTDGLAALLLLAHRALAAPRAISIRRSELSRSARIFPPLAPPSFPRATRPGSFPVAGSGSASPHAISARSFAAWFGSRGIFRFCIYLSMADLIQGVKRMSYSN